MSYLLQIPMNTHLCPFRNNHDSIPSSLLWQRNQLSAALHVDGLMLPTRSPSPVRNMAYKFQGLNKVTFSFLFSQFMMRC